MKQLIGACVVASLLGADLTAQSPGGAFSDGVAGAMERIRAQRLAEAALEEQHRHAVAEEALLKFRIEAEREAIALQVEQSRLAADGAKGQVALTAIASLTANLLKVQEGQIALATELRQQLRQHDEALTAIIEYVRALPPPARTATRAGTKPAARVSPGTPSIPAAPSAIPQPPPASIARLPPAASPPPMAVALAVVTPAANLEGLTPDQVRVKLGTPSLVDNRNKWVTWYYDGPGSTTMVYFVEGKATRRKP